MSERDPLKSVHELGDLQILGAVYGLLDVTNRVIDRVDRNTVPQSLPETPASNSVFPDGWPGEDKTLTVFYRYGQTGRFGVVTATEYGKGLTIKGPSFTADGTHLTDELANTVTLLVLGATYGPADVTGKVAGLVDTRTQTLNIRADNATFGDPWKKRKVFVALVQYGSDPAFLLVAKENERVECKYSPPVKILSAFWGLQDVSPKILQLAVRGSVAIRADRAAFGDGWPGVDKTLAVVYQHEQQEPQLVAVKEGDTLKIEYNERVPKVELPLDPSALNVIRAAYGPLDVTAKVRSHIQKNELKLVANNSTFPDSWRGTDKSFALTYSWGPSIPKSQVFREGSQVQISKSHDVWDPLLIPLLNLFGDGDQVRIQATNGSFWKVNGSKQVKAGTDSMLDGDWFTVRIDAPQPLVITLQTKNGEFLRAGTDGTLYASALRQSAAKLVPSLCRDGSIVFGLLGREGQPFIALDDRENISAGGSPSTSPGAGFYVSLKSTAEGDRSHWAALGLNEGVRATNDSDMLLATIVYDLTVGLFVALALGRLIGKAIDRMRLLTLVRGNERSWNALIRLLRAIRSDPSKEFVSSLMSFLLTLWEENVLLAIARIVFKAAAFWVIGWALVKILQFILLPEVAAAELVVSFGFWVNTVIEDTLAYANSEKGKETVLLADGSGCNERGESQPMLSNVN